MTGGWQPGRSRGFCLSLLASWTPGFSALPCELVLTNAASLRRKTAATEEECRAAPALGSPSVPALVSGTMGGFSIRGKGTQAENSLTLSFSLGVWWFCPQREAIHWSWDLETLRVLSLFLGSKTSSCQAIPVSGAGMHLCPLRLNQTSFGDSTIFTG